MNLEALIKDTDALTYVNALKVTLAEIKDEASTVEETIGYANQAVERIRKLLRKADNQYRMVARAAQQSEGGIANNISIDENASEEYKKIMEGIDND